MLQIITTNINCHFGVYASRCGVRLLRMIKIDLILVYIFCVNGPYVQEPIVSYNNRFIDDNAIFMAKHFFCSHGWEHVYTCKMMDVYF